MRNLALPGAVLAAGLLLASAPALANPPTGNAANERLDRRGARIEERLDQRGDRIDTRLDARSDRALENGHAGRAEHLDRRGDRIDQRLDRRGDRAEHRLDARGNRIDRRRGGLAD
jgi:hypothetical protein